MNPATAGRYAGTAWRHSAPLLSFAWALARTSLAALVLAIDAFWRHRQAIRGGIMCALVCAYVAAEGALYAGRRFRAFLARLGAPAVIPAAQQLQALRQALLRFLARRYGWRLA